MNPMSSNHSTTPRSMKTRLAALSKGLRTALQPTDQLDVSGALTLAPSVADAVDKDLALFTDTDDAHQTYEEKKEVRNTSTPDVLARLEAVEAALTAKLGATSTRLASFG